MIINLFTKFVNFAIESANRDVGQAAINLIPPKLFDPTRQGCLQIHFWLIFSIALTLLSQHN